MFKCSPKSSFPSSNTRKGRPSTPHFAAAENHSDETEHEPGSCIGISLATVMNTFRGPSSTNSDLPTSPSSVQGDHGIFFRRFFGFRSTVQKLSCAERRSDSRSNASVSSSYIDDRHISDDPFDTHEQKSLMQRAASWSTQETANDSTLIQRNGNNVHFHYPPITSVRLRPRTESGDVPKLFFAPEELDEIEDDRSDTRAADDVETLAVIQSWDAVPTLPSVVTAVSDFDDQDSRSGFLLAGDGSPNAVVFNQKGSQRKKDDTHTDKRYVRGVQIMLREKSTR